MKKFLLRFLPVLLIVCIMVQPIPVSAAEPCSMTLEYSHNGTVFPELEIRIFRVGEYDPNGNHHLVTPFDKFPVKIDGITSQQEWKDAANTLSAYAVAKQLTPDRTGETNKSGVVTFTELKEGIYLICGISASDDTQIYEFENFFLILPTPQSDGTFQNDVTAKPKCSVTEKPEGPQYKTYQVVKLWKDAGNRNARPVSITVDISKNGVVQETVKLSSGNNWSYSWSALDDGGTWTVVEKDVPGTYKVVITSSGSTFQITNTNTNPKELPQTGDTSSVLLYVITMCLAGFGLLILGMPMIRRSGHEKNR